jgi:surface antigen
VFAIFSKYSNKLKKAFKRKGFVYANVVLVIAVTGVVWFGQSGFINSSGSTIFSKISNELSEAPLDPVSSADIAANIATVSSLPEAVSVINQADSYNAHLDMASIDNTTVAKPNIVSGGSKSRKDIIEYVTQVGDTISALAIKFGVTSDSIRWSNGLSGDSVDAGKTIFIPPVNGVVYKVQSGDTVEGIAARYSANKDQIIAFNDIELSGLPVNDYIVIPDGTQPVANNTSYSGYSVSSTIVYEFSPQYGGNSYTYGYCTYYVASRIPVPGNWGNANTWAYYARLSGWTVSPIPVVGAIAQSPYMSGLGHVAYVEEVSADGTMMRYSDMNALCGWNCVGYSEWVPISFYPNYIYH